MLDTIAMAEQLSGEYRSAFERADIYSAGTMEEGLDEKMMELYKRLMEAEQNNQPVEDVVGNDIELFCKNFFVEEKKRYTLKEALDSLFAIMCGLLIYTLLQLLLEEKQSNLLPFVAGFAAGDVVEVLAKIRKRKQKRGREYTFQDFAQLIRKEEKITKKGNWVFIIITALIVVVPGINIMVEETLFDGFIFILIMGVFEYFICRLVVKSNIDSMKTQLSLIEEYEQSNIDILEYVEGNTKKFE